MHEIVKYFIFTEIQKQCLNPMPERLIRQGSILLASILDNPPGSGLAGRPAAELDLAALASAASLATS